MDERLANKPNFDGIVDGRGLKFFDVIVIGISKWAKTAAFRNFVFSIREKYKLISRSIWKNCNFYT